MNQPLPMLQVDAYTAVAFAGSPARVCFLDHERPASWLKSVAAEMNLPEIAFLLPRGDGYHLRCSTWDAEVRLCGYATRGQRAVRSPKHSPQE